MKKTYLILTNNAFKMAPVHIALAETLKSKGHNVIIALSDKLPYYQNNIEFSSEFKTYIFSEFFRNNYSNIEIQDKYTGININKLFYSEYDRNIVFGKQRFKGNGYYQRVMTNLINFFDSIFEENDIDLILYESISNSFAYAAYEVGKVNNVKYCGYAGSRLKGRAELYTEEFGNKDKFAQKFRNCSINSISAEEEQEIREYLLQYKANRMPSYHPKKTKLDWNYSFIKRYFNKTKFNLFFKTLLYQIKNFNNLKFSYQSTNPLGELLFLFSVQLRKKWRIFFISKLFDSVNNEDKYYLYPQHFKPEASTSILAQNYCSDISVIENIAFNLPFGSYLYVKEHYVNYGRFPVSYYKKLKNIPNVKLIHCEENTKQLIDNAEAIITLTSTVGFEALMANKPVFVFGNVFYECHPNCKKLNTFEQLYRELSHCYIKTNDNNDNNLRFIHTYKNMTFESNVYYFLENSNYNLHEEFIYPFIKAIEQYEQE